MWRENVIEDAETIKQILLEAKNIAVIGLKNDPDSPSYRVASYLQKAGYKIIPVNPKYDTILGEKVYRKLTEISESIDVVDIFRASKRVIVHLDEVLAVKPNVAWMQAGIENWEAAEAWAKAGIKVVMNRCMMSEHAVLFGAEEIPTCPVSFSKRD